MCVIFGYWIIFLIIGHVFLSVCMLGKLLLDARSNFTLLGTIYFCISIKILELSSGSKNKLLGNSFEPFNLLWLVRWDQTQLYTANYFPVLRQNTSVYSANLEVFLSGWHSSQLAVSTRYTSNPVRWFFPILG